MIAERPTHVQRAGMRRVPAPSGALALIQGGSYIAFASWSLLARRHYRRVHELDASQWILNAHGMWMLLVGTVLVTAGARGEMHRSELRLLAAGSALGLATNDAVAAVTEGVAPIYRRDLAWELSLLGLELLAWQRESSR